MSLRLTESFGCRSFARHSSFLSSRTRHRVNAITPPTRSAPSLHLSCSAFAYYSSSSADTPPKATSEHTSPIARYKALIEKGLLREDSYQLHIVENKLEKLHEELKTYKQNVRPESETASKTKGGGGLVSQGMLSLTNVVCGEELTNPVYILVSVCKVVWKKGTRRRTWASANTARHSQGTISLRRCWMWKEVRIRERRKTHLGKCRLRRYRKRIFSIAACSWICSMIPYLPT
jgi:hypothetical protein